MSEITMADAIAAGNGTLHGAIDYWQERALNAERQAAELKDALLDALDWNWLDDDAPPDLLKKYYDMAARPEVKGE